MVKNISYMLDSTITAVDEGFSYDGIVSVPETGLEDSVRHRPDLVGSFRDSVDRIRMTSGAVSRGTIRAFKQRRRNFNHSMFEGGFDGGFKKQDRSNVSPALSEHRSEDLILVQDEKSSFDVVCEEGDKQLYSHEPVIVQPRTTPQLEEDGTPHGCFPWLLSRKRSSEIITVEDTCTSRRGKTTQLERDIKEDWEVISPTALKVDQEGSPSSLEGLEVHRPLSTIEAKEENRLLAVEQSGEESQG